MKTLGFDVDQSKVDHSWPAAVTSSTFRPSGSPSTLPTSASMPTADMRRLGRTGRPVDLRAHAAERQPRPGPDLYRADRPADRRCTAPGQLSSWKARPIPARRATSCCRSCENSGLKAGKRLFPRLQPRARGPGQSRLHAPSGFPRSSAASMPRSAELAAAALQPGRRQGRAGLQLRGGRGVQDPGEHLPRREHRPGQRAEGALRPDGHRRLGSDRRGQDQAVRLPGVLSRSGAGRALHPDRPVLSDAGWPASTACPRASSSWPARSTRHAALRRSIGSAEALNDRGKPVQRSQIACWEWPTRKTWTTRARARRSS